jgi:hypothetical protein
MTATIHTFPRRVPVGRAVLLAGHPQVIDLRRVYEADLAIALGEEEPPRVKVRAVIGVAVLAAVTVALLGVG